jgi:hypothetical protein
MLSYGRHATSKSLAAPAPIDAVRRRKIPGTAFWSQRVPETETEDDENAVRR